MSHCCKSISFPIGLSGFLVYAWVAISVAPEHISFLSSVLISPSSSTPVIVSSVLKFPAASSLSWFAPIFVTLHLVDHDMSELYESTRSCRLKLRILIIWRFNFEGLVYDTGYIGWGGGRTEGPICDKDDLSQPCLLRLLPILLLA